MFYVFDQVIGAFILGIEIMIIPLLPPGTDSAIFVMFGPGSGDHRRYGGCDAIYSRNIGGF